MQGQLSLASEKQRSATTSRSTLEFFGPAAKFADTHQEKPGNSFFPPLAIQTKLSVNQPGDAYELEADAMAEQVMQGSGTVQRSCLEGGNEKRVDRKEINASGVEATDTTSVEETINRSGQAMPDGVKTFMETQFGKSFEDVKIHDDAQAHQSSKSINALAYTHRNHIAFAAGQYQPATDAGKKLIAHELTHVVQQTNSVQKKSGPGLIQRADVPSPVHYLSFPQILTKTVSQFINYINTQTDWFSASSLTEDQREEVEFMIFFANTDVQAVFGNKTIQQFFTLFNTVGELADERKNRLQAYAAAASARKYPFEISDFAANLTQAIAIGADILKLSQGFPDYVLHTAMKEQEFRDLRTHNFIDDLIAYYSTATQRPVFEADNGRDFASFTLFRLSGTSPLHYDSTVLVNRIRNFHRFEKAALDRLITNYGNTSKTLPLTLILHTALDHNGAFHRDPNLTAVITNNTMLTLMVEGFETLGGIQAQIGPLATTYGRNDRIDQLMFAGHGNARVIQLAGSVEERVNDAGDHVLGEVTNSVNLDASNRTDTDNLINEVLAYMDNDSTLPADRQPHARIVFNACLTGSNSVREAISEGDLAAARAHVTTYIHDHASLATFLDQYAASNNAGLITSIGSNASFGLVGLINPHNELDIISAGDPAITAPKIDYVERGTETAGALRAVLESWANDVAATLDAMRRRLATTEGNAWNTLLIRKAYQVILGSFSSNAEKIRLVGAAAEPVAELRFEANNNIEKHDRANANAWAADPSTDDFFDDLVGALTAASEFGNTRIKLSILQLWLMKAAAKDADFMSGLAATTVNNMLRFTDITFLEDNRGALTRLFTSSNNAAKLRLALIGVLGSNANETCKNYLIGLLAGGTTFPASLHIDAALGGAAAQAEIIDTLGINAAAPSPPTATGTTPPAAPTHTANIRLHGETTNTLFVRPIHQYSEFIGYLVIIPKERPDPSSPAAGEPTDERRFYVIGETGDYYAVQYLYEGETIPSVAFIRKRTGPHSLVTNLNP